MIMIMTWRDILSFGTLPNPTTAVLQKDGMRGRGGRWVEGGGSEWRGERVGDIMWEEKEVENIGKRESKEKSKQNFYTPNFL